MNEVTFPKENLKIGLFVKLEEPLEDFGRGLEGGSDLGMITVIEKDSYQFFSFFSFATHHYHFTKQGNCPFIKRIVEPEEVKKYFKEKEETLDRDIKWAEEEVLKAKQKKDDWEKKSQKILQETKLFED